MSFFDFIKPLAGAAASIAGGPLAGSLISGGLNFLGAQEQNAANAASAQQQQQFNAEQAAISREWQGGENQADRDYNAQQALLARDFNASEANTARSFARGQASKSRTFNRRESVKSRKYLTKMSNSAHQRQVRDLRKAGLNPILSARYGGSSTPAGPMASSSPVGGAAASGPSASSKAGGAPGAASGAMARMENMSSIATASALAYKRTAAEVAKMREDTKRAQAETRNVRALERVNHQELRNRRATEIKIGAETGAITQSAATDLAREGDLVSSRDLKYQQGQESAVRVKVHKASASNINVMAAATAQRIRALKTKMAGLLEEEKIDQSTYAKMLRWIGRMNPFSSTAKDLLPFVKGFK